MVLLGLITSKRPNDLSFGENKDIVEWVTDEAALCSPSSSDGDGENHDNRRAIDLRQIVDPRMKPTTKDFQEIEMVLSVALLCIFVFPIIQLYVPSDVYFI